MSDGSRLNLEEVGPHGRPAQRGFLRRRVGWAGRHPVLALGPIAVFVLLGFGLEWNYFPSRPTLDADAIESVTVRLTKYPPSSSFGPGYEQEAASVTTQDPAVIRPLLDVFRTANRASEHNCGDSGVIEFRRKDGTVEELSILPGHDVRFYEYRLGSRINRVDRESFLAALRAMGVTGVKTVPP